MFEGKIRPCLECGTIPEPPDTVLAEGILCEKCSLAIPNATGFMAVNYWNLANTPPEDITHLKYYYARFNMTLPGLEEVSK